MSDFAFRRNTNVEGLPKSRNRRQTKVRVLVMSHHDS